MRRHDKRNNPRTAHVRHILVPDKPLARKLIEEIAAAKNPLKMFKKSAKIYSTCPSGSKKGDLGVFTEGQMVIEFETAVWDTEVDEIPSKFIKTQFGYHIIWVHSKAD
jgi:peptidyl-prolyl cis-trans isomerase C